MYVLAGLAGAFRPLSAAGRGAAALVTASLVVAAGVGHGRESANRLTDRDLRRRDLGSMHGHAAEEERAGEQRDAERASHRGCDYLAAHGFLAAQGFAAPAPCAALKASGLPKT